MLNVSYFIYSLVGNVAVSQCLTLFLYFLDDGNSIWLLCCLGAVCGDNYVPYAKNGPDCLRNYDMSQRYPYVC